MVKLVYKYKNLILSDRRLRRKLKNLSLTFTRSGVAYDYQGNSVPENTPRFTHLINGVLQHGILIEEAHTNLLSAGASQSLSHDTPYTTGTLNGTYTFQCEGTGSYVLSGGATGTVSKDNPVTAAVSSATVTLTPATTSTLNQVIKLAYPLSFVLGGVTQNAETLTAPSSVLNIDTNGYSNLLPASQANSLSSGSPYTTGTLVAGVAYTFSCGTGSYELSGGRGTVTPSNPITVTPGAVTVTLTGDSTLNQLSATSGVKPWIPGGTQQNTGTGTIEMEVYPKIGTNSGVGIFHATSGGKNYIYSNINSATSWKFTTTDKVGTSSNSVANGITLNQWNNIAQTFDTTSIKNQANGGTIVANTSPKLPEARAATFEIGSAFGSQILNGLIRDFTVSLPKRSDTDTSNRSSQNVNGLGFKVDKEIKLVAPLKNNLSAYRVRG